MAKKPAGNKPKARTPGRKLSFEEAKKQAAAQFHKALASLAKK
jgi:hypothetical protein